MTAKLAQPPSVNSERPVYQTQGSGPAFVYVPGIEGTGKLFYKQVDDLARDHTVITYPLRAAGRYGMDELISDLVWIIRDAGFERATALGESFGGLLLMAATIAHPECFERLILVNTFPRFEEQTKIRLGVALFSFLPYPAMKAYRKLAGGRTLFAADVAVEDRRACREHTRAVACEGYLSRMRITRDTDLRGRLSEIQAPTLVVAATEDRLLNATRSARIIASAIPRSRLKLLAGAGHLALVSSRVRVRDWLDEFQQS
ncbi:MAG TPA: alpha/beta hydrolase [Pyrinomonadaceae bacterium]|jgi:pimeloyl-ACP methyl ester carboxylesterase